MSADYSSSEPVSNSFSRLIEMEVKLIAQNKCWICSSTPVDVVQVVDEEDPAVDFLVEAGIINFSLTSASNAIALCPSCYRNFDQLFDPGFIFVPSDLRCFISFEEKDFERRSRLASQGIPLDRTCPTKTEYHEHQLSQGVISSDSPGGLYRKVILKKYQPFMDMNLFTPLQSWQGAPMAAIRSAFMALGTPRIAAIPTAVRDDLRRLQDLYSREPTILPTVPRDITLPHNRKGERDD